MKRSECSSRNSLYRDATKFRESLFSASNRSNYDSESVDAVFVDFVNTSCCEINKSSCEVDNEQDYSESDDSGENEDDELSEIESSFEENDDPVDKEESLENRVAAIAIKHRLSGAAVRSLLIYLTV